MLAWKAVACLRCRVWSRGLRPYTRVSLLLPSVNWGLVSRSLIYRIKVSEATGRCSGTASIRRVLTLMTLGHEQFPLIPPQLSTAAGVKHNIDGYASFSSLLPMPSGQANLASIRLLSSNKAVYEPSDVSLGVPCISYLFTWVKCLQN